MYQSSLKHYLGSSSEKSSCSLEYVFPLVFIIHLAKAKDKDIIMCKDKGIITCKKTASGQAVKARAGSKGLRRQ
jgi:hypothetical protein